MNWKRDILIRLAILALTVVGGIKSNGAVPEPKFGTQSPTIGTFDGWTGWVGWEGGFSDTYEPIKEKYDWVVYFAPEAIYVALQASMADYTGVDVNLGYKYFYGFLKSPNADKTLTGAYVDNIWSVSISKDAIGLFEGIGPMSHLSMGLEVEAAFFRVEHTRTLVPALQFGAGFSISYSLLPINLPFCIELDRDWIYSAERGNKPAFSGFWPIAIWKRTVVPGQNPVEQIQAGLQALAGNTNVPATTFVMAGTLAPLMQQLVADADLRAFFTDPRGSSSYGQGLIATENWLASGDPGQAPISVVPGADKKVPEVVKPILVGTQLAFETGYRVGAQANPNNKKIYVDGVVTNYCYVGEPCRIEVYAKELSDVISNTVPANFEGAWIGFSYPQEYMISHGDIGSRQWVQITNGVATFTFNEGFSTPQMVGVLYSDSDSGNWNGGHDVELKRHVLMFLDPTDANGNNIPDFWEKQYGLTNNAPGADADKDGFTDLQEYLAGTNPTNALDYLNVQLSLATRELVLPFTSNVRHYVIQANTNSIANKSSWTDVMDFYGSDGEERIDLSAIFSEPKAFFRLKVTKP